MPPGLEGHTVSLTKNGYFKLSDLIRKYPSSEILEHLDEIKLDFTQARKMLAGNSSNVLPLVWDDVRQYDNEAQTSLLLFSIIFSHKDLIRTFIASATAEMRGEIKRDGLDQKTYTNLAYALEEAGLAIGFAEGAESTKYDLSKIFLKNEIGPLAKKILKSHLENMGWNEPSESQPFQRTFEEQVKYYEFNKVLGVSIEQLFNWFNGSNVVRHTEVVPISQIPFTLTSLIQSIDQANLKYSPKLISRFIASLLTKPFVILTGLSGSGKTKLAQVFVQWICLNENQYCIIPVGADWTNREPLLGYPNALKPEDYVKPDSGILDLIINANDNPDIPHFLILDEMNLSHVERYFADFLSVMESKKEIPLYAGNQVNNGVPSKLKLPSNLFIIGTVNIDETTNMFSPKVLDRANTIEFRIAKSEMEVFFDSIKELNLDTLNRKGAEMSKSFLDMAENKSFPTEITEEVRQTLVLFFEELQKNGAEFGYRSGTEILRLINQLSALDSSLSMNEKLDIAIVQKLLPKLHGSRRKLCPILTTLASFCINIKMKIEKDIFENDGFDFNAENVLYPLSLEKIARMYKGAIDNGFASFAEA